MTENRRLGPSILAWDNLCNAWERVADNRGAPGIDHVSIGRFARHWEENLRRLRELVQSNRYRPAGLRRVAIPKRTGGQRLLSIPICHAYCTSHNRLWESCKASHFG
jgi:retron-type reverse transcriptase